MVIVLALHSGAGTFNFSAQNFCASALKNSSINSAFMPEPDRPNAREKYNGPLIHAIMELEKCPKLNCGIGSNLTEEGTVECEAAFMCSEKLAFGAVASVTNCIHPIYMAQKLACPYQSNSVPDGLVAPMVLVGPGANGFCTSLGVGIVTGNNKLITDAIKKDHKIARKMLSSAVVSMGNNEESPSTSSIRLDTVGGVLIDLDSGYVESGVSSGGIMLKRPGRVGHSAHFGAAIWAEQRGDISIAISLSGCGEALTRTQMAEKLAEFAFTQKLDDPFLPEQIKIFLEASFLNSNRLLAFPRDRLLLGGLMLIKFCSTTIQLISFHNSQHFPFAFIGRSCSRISKSKSVNDKIGITFVCTAFNL